MSKVEQSELKNLTGANSDTVISEAAERIVALGPEAIEQAIKFAERQKAASRNVSVSRAQIELSGHLCRAVGEPARAISAKHLRDDRHEHIAMFANKKEATAFMLDLVAALPTEQPAEVAEQKTAAERAVEIAEKITKQAERVERLRNGSSEDGRKLARALPKLQELIAEGEKIRAELPDERAGYSSEQLAEAARLRTAEKLSWAKIAETIGVKSPVHFSNRVRAAHPEAR
jgi:hypothetical protein